MPESADGLGDPLDPLNEQPHPQPEGAGGLAEDSMRTAFDVCIVSLKTLATSV